GDPAAGERNHVEPVAADPFRRRAVAEGDVDPGQVGWALGADPPLEYLHGFELLAVQPLVEDRERGGDPELARHEHVALAERQARPVPGEQGAADRLAVRAQRNGDQMLIEQLGATQQLTGPPGWQPPLRVDTVPRLAFDVDRGGIRQSGDRRLTEQPCRLLRARAVADR